MTSAANPLSSYWRFTEELVVYCLQYEPELFPGLIYRMKQPKIVLLIFVSGKIVLTGAKVRLCRLQSSDYASKEIDNCISFAEYFVHAFRITFIYSC